jgi:Putative transposase/Transposase zinc-binding domain
MDLADVVRRHGPAYLDRFGDRIPQAHRRALEAILRCHTPACGGSLYLCPECGDLHFHYHGCGHRACGQCGHAQAQAWLERHAAHLLPVDYFLATFTVPEALRPWIRSEQTFFYDLLLRESAATLQDVAGQPRYGLEGRLGMLSVLHTWTRQLIYHPHVHCVIPAAALREDGSLGWPNQRDFLLPVQRLSARWRSRLKQALFEQRPDIAAKINPGVWHSPWVVHLQPAGRGRQALEYLSRYIFRTAISSARLLWQDDHHVCFGYTDAKTGQQRECTLSGMEFLRRFLQHVLPKGFHRVRSYGWLSPAAKDGYERICALLNAIPAAPQKPGIGWRVLCKRCHCFMQHIAPLSRGPP